MTDEEVSVETALIEMLPTFAPDSDWSKHLITGGHLMHQVFRLLRNKYLADDKKMIEIKGLANEFMIDFYVNVDKIEKEVITMEDFFNQYLIR